jgi:hypothetical protein
VWEEFPRKKEIEMGQKEKLERSIRLGNSASVVAGAFAVVVVLDYAVNGQIDQINSNYTIAIVVIAGVVAVAGQYLARKAHHYRFHRKHAA